MKKWILAVTVLFSTSALAADCFWAQRVRSFDVVDASTMTVDTGREEFELDLSLCMELRWAHKIGFKSFGSRVCRGDQVLVFDNFSNHVVESCRILKVTKIN